jgi:glycosyltransferase involved in cell wall biosynthesis
MLCLATYLRRRYRISFVCPPTLAGLPFLQRAARLGLETLALEVRGEPAAEEQLRHWLRSRAVTIFHGHAGIGWEGHQGIRAARAAGVRAVLRTEHLPYLITDPYQRHQHQRSVQAIDRLVCVSEEAGCSYLAMGVPAAKLRIVRNGISPRPVRPDRNSVREELGLPASGRLVLTVARFTEQKGHRYLLQAIPAVVAHDPTAYFIWVGLGPLERELRQRAHELGIDRHLAFLGQRDDVPALLGAADLLVLPSLFEGLPLVALEAMARGLPVVGTRVCGTNEVIQDGVTGRLVPAGDAAALASALLELLARPDLRASWGRAGRRRFERHFTAARMARETARLYEESLRQPDSVRDVVDTSHMGRGPAAANPEAGANIGNI